MILFANHLGDRHAGPSQKPIDYEFEPATYEALFTRVLFATDQPTQRPAPKRSQRAATEARVIDALSGGKAVAMAELEQSLLLHRDYIYTVLVRLESAGSVKRTGRNRNTQWMAA